MSTPNPLHQPITDLYKPDAGEVRDALLKVKQNYLGTKLSSLDAAAIKAELVEALKSKGFSSAYSLVMPALSDLATTEEEGALPLNGQPLAADTTPPWSEPVDGTELLDAMATAFRRHIVFSWKEQADIAALWSLWTHVYDCFSIAPMLAVSSPVPECGKTQLLEVVAGLSWNPLPAANITAAALFRVMDKFRPTLIADEADAWLPENEPLRGVFNAGHKKSMAYVVRTEKVGDEFVPQKFSTWGAKALGYIEKGFTLPPTIAGRSFIIALRRKKAGEEVEPFDESAERALLLLKQKAVRWAQDHTEELKQAPRPPIPSGLSNRIADNARPLLALADAVGGSWPERARAAVLSLAQSKAGKPEDSVGIKLLTDLRAIFGTAAHWTTDGLLEALKQLDTRPWATFRKGRDPIDANGLARLLKPYGIRPKTLRLEVGGRQRCYLLEDLKDAFERYLPLSDGDD